MIIVELKPDAALFSDPQSEEAEIQNLMLNMIGGLRYENLTQDEKNLLEKHGYKP